jgi:hypothetical protein
MQHSKFTPEHIAPCGMNCGICVSFFGYTLSDRKRKNPCKGCRLRDKQCILIKKQCDKLLNKKIKYCFECLDFPCKTLKKLDTRYKTNYEMSMIENLENIKKNGIQKFLESERERWKCLKCGGIICVHNKKCYTCGIN